MEHVDPAELIKLAAAALTVIMIAVAGVFKGHNDKNAEPDTKAEVLAASVMDTRTLRDLSSAAGEISRAAERLREQQHDDSRALRSCLEELTTELRRNTAAQDQGAITPRDMMMMLGRMQGAGT